MSQPSAPPHGVPGLRQAQNPALRPSVRCVERPDAGLDPPEALPVERIPGGILNDLKDIGRLRGGIADAVEKGLHLAASCIEPAHFRALAARARPVRIP